MGGGHRRRPGRGPYKTPEAREGENRHKREVSLGEPLNREQLEEKGWPALKVEFLKRRIEGWGASLVGFRHDRTGSGVGAPE